MNCYYSFRPEGLTDKLKRLATKIPAIGLESYRDSYEKKSPYTDGFGFSRRSTIRVKGSNNFLREIGIKHLRLRDDSRKIIPYFIQAGYHGGVFIYNHLNNGLVLPEEGNNNDINDSLWLPNSRAVKLVLGAYAGIDRDLFFTRSDELRKASKSYFDSYGNDNDSFASDIANPIFAEANNSAAVIAVACIDFS